MTDWRDHLGDVFTMDAGTADETRVRLMAAHKSAETCTVMDLVTSARTDLSWSSAEVRLT